MKIITKEAAELYRDEAVRELNNFYDNMSDEDANGEYFKWIALKNKNIT